MEIRILKKNFEAKKISSAAPIPVLHHPVDLVQVLLGIFSGFFALPFLQTLLVRSLLLDELALRPRQSQTAGPEGNSGLPEGPWKTNTPKLVIGINF